MLRRRTIAASALAGLALITSTVLVAGPAQAAATQACSASVTVQNPHHNGTTQVVVTRVAGGATVTTVARYKTTSTRHSARAAAAGSATLTYRVASATYGRQVPVQVTAVKGAARWTCSTSFTPLP